MPFEVPELLRAAGGRIVGKVRLQKIVYLLDQLGLNSKFSFDYHYYGPYSEELADAIDDCIAFGRITETTERRVSDGVRYSVFRAPDDEGNEYSGKVGDLPLREAKAALSAMDDYSATVLELAATINWIACFEEGEDWPTELRRRKGIKAAEGRMEEAVQLLAKLGLPPAAQ